MSQYPYVGIIEASLQDALPGASLEHFQQDGDLAECWQYDGGLYGMVLRVSAPFQNAGGGISALCSVDPAPGREGRLEGWDFSGSIGSWQDPNWVAGFRCILKMAR